MIPFEPVGYSVALILGWFLKNKTKVSNQAIPLINFAVQFLGAVLLQIQPAEAGVFGALGKLGEGLLPIALEAVVNTVAATGTQSGAKATGRVLGYAFKQGILAKLLEKLSKEAEK